MNQWNQMVDIFGGSGTGDEIPEYAADNICIAWPSILNCIEKEFINTTSIKALDYGCGGGLFCKKLNEMGYQVTGYDESEELANAAQINTPEEVTITNSMAIAAENGKYDLVSSIMVFQFIEDIESTINSIISMIKENGLIIFSVFNPKFIEDNANNGVFTEFNSFRKGYMELKDGFKVPVYNRTEAEYRELIEAKGFEQVYIDYPAFSEEFLRQYKMPLSTKYPEYLIQAFRGKNT